MKKAIIIIVVLIILAVGGFFGYRAMQNKSETGGGTVLSKLNPNCKYNDPDLCKFINNWKGSKYYSMTMTATASDGKVQKTVFKSITADKKSQMINSTDGKESYNVISIGDSTYTLDYTDNRWSKYTYTNTVEPTATATNELDFGDKADTVEDKTTYTKIGTEACDKLTCFKYQVVDPTYTEATQFIYFDSKDYQLRKMRSESKTGEISESTFDYSKVTIEIPTKK